MNLKNGVVQSVVVGVVMATVLLTIAVVGHASVKFGLTLVTAAQEGCPDWTMPR